VPASGSGETADQRALLARFPQYQAQLSILFQCHDLLATPPAPPQMPNVGDMLGDFYLAAELGRGAQGRGFIATQLALSERPMVLKVAGREDASISPWRACSTPTSCALFGARRHRAKPARVVHALFRRRQPRHDSDGPVLHSFQQARGARHSRADRSFSSGTIWSKCGREARPGISWRGAAMWRRLAGSALAWRTPWNMRTSASCCIWI